MKYAAPPWEKRYYRKLLWTDVLATSVAVSLAAAIAYRSSPAQPEHLAKVALFAALSLAVCLSFLALFDARSSRLYGSGVNEYRQVFNALLGAFGTLALALIALGDTPVRRLMLLTLMPLAVFTIIGGRWMWRKRLHSQRKKGRHSYRTLIVGDPDNSGQILKQLRSNPLTGFHLVGAITKNGSGAPLAKNVPVIGAYRDVVGVIDDHDIDALIIIGSSKLTPKRIRRISWSLEDRRVQMILATSLTDIAGPRVHVRPVAGLPLIQVEQPVFYGWRVAAKRTLDLVLTMVALIPSAIIMLVLAIAIRIDSPGRVIFKQERIGLNGDPFTMYKLRSMREGAADELPGLLDSSDGNDVLFKMKDDPRITKVGRFMRRHSLDELPQLFNVLKGEMSLVGPRPPLAHETDLYKNWLRERRFLVKPGVSGLWQVSGRSELSWEDSVRLDLFYVENWTVLGDLLILWRTMRLVVRPKGAY